MRMLGGIYLVDDDMLSQASVSFHFIDTSETYGNLVER